MQITTVLEESRHFMLKLDVTEDTPYVAFVDAIEGLLSPQPVIHM